MTNTTRGKMQSLSALIKKRAAASRLLIIPTDLRTPKFRPSHIKRGQLRREEDCAERAGVHEVYEHGESHRENQLMMLDELRHLFLPNIVVRRGVGVTSYAEDDMSA